MAPDDPPPALPPRRLLRRAREEMVAGFSERFRDGGLGTGARARPAEVAAAEADPQRRLGRYVLVERIGRGAMASVWRSWDRELGRWVAVKVLQEPEAGTQRARFFREAQATANLRHPNLVTIFDAGEHEGRLFLVMELVRGKPFDVAAPREQAVDALRKVALALEEAHRQGIVHRDVKPGNIMVDERGEPRVVDFGLAHLVDDVQSRLTRTGATIGTPIYMAPEQVAGRTESIGAATDVYALGVILYEILAGRPPHAGGSATEIYGRILSDDPVAPSKLNANAPRDLETVALKALDKEPLRRYPTAAAFAEDLRRWLAGEPVLARRSWFVQRWRRWIGRRRRAAAVVLILVAALGVTSSVLVSRLSAAQRTVALWGRISNLLTEAERYSRAGERDSSRMRLDEGIAACRDFLRSTELPHARYFLGRFLRARGHDVEAERELGLALDADPALGEARLERGLLRAERYGRGIRGLQVGAIIEREVVRPGDRPEAGALERQHPELKILREAAALDLAAASGRSSYFREVDGLFGRADLALLEGRDVEAERQLKKVLEIDPLHTAARVSLATVADHRGDLDGAIRELNACIERDQGLADAWSGRAQALMVKALFDPSAAAKDVLLESASRDLDRALALLESPVDRALAHSSRAKVRMERRDLAGALQDLDRSIELDPAVHVTFSMRGYVRAAMGDGDGALRDFDAALKLRRDSPFTLNNRGMTLLQRGDLDGAVRDFDAAIAADPRAGAPLLNRGTIRHRREDYAGAVADFDRAIDLNPRLAEAFFGRGNAQLALKRYDEAARDFAAAVDIDPRYVKAHLNLAWTQATRYDALRPMGRIAEAEVARTAAIRAYDRAIELGLPDERDRPRIEADLRHLRADY